MKDVVLSLSGGMDSSSLLIHLLAKGHKVTALSFDYGQKHKCELERAVALVEYLKVAGKPVEHQIIDLSTLTPLLNSALVEGGNEVPEGHYENENMKATVVPNRNKIFASIIQAVALSKVNVPPTRQKHFVGIALGIHAGDHAVYPDCRQEFRDADHEAFLQGNWDGEYVSYITPYLEIDKEGILEDGFDSCVKLDISFKEVYKRTMTSYKPIQHEGRWYADYKSASSVERVEAFLALGIEDPCEYANENGPVSWDTVTLHVTKVLEENKKS